MKHFYFKLIVLLLLLFIFSGENVFSQQVVFGYDAAGNQISRSWICANCPGQMSSVTSKELQLLDNSAFIKDEQKSSVSRSLTAYPNPVTETLKLSWSSTNDITLKSIEIYSVVGVKVFQDSYPAGQTETSISFLNFPAGGYMLRAIYSDGKKEIVKIIKQ